MKRLTNSSNLFIRKGIVMMNRISYFFILMILSSNISIADESLNQQLREAASEGNTAFVSELVGKGADIDAPGKYGKTPLMFAAELGKTDTIAILLSHDANVNARTKSGSTALTFAAENGHASITAMLVQLGANVHDRTRAGWNSLMIASKNGYDIIVAQLLEFGADVRSSDRKGNSAMMYAIKEGHPKVIKTLFQYSDLVAPCLPNHQGVTPMMAAIDNNQQEIFDILLPVSENLKFKDKYGANALHYAAESGKLSFVKSLINKGNVDINSQDDDGDSPLIEAVEKGSVEIVSYLLSKGADVSLKTTGGKTAKDIATEKGNAEVLKLFE